MIVKIGRHYLKSLVLLLITVPMFSMAAFTEDIQTPLNKDAPIDLKRLCDSEIAYEVQQLDDDHFVLTKHPWFPDWKIELSKESNDYYFGQNGYVFSRLWALDNNLYALNSGEFTPHGELGESVSVLLNEQNCN